MKLWVLPVIGLSILLTGCITPEQQKTADEERCRSYGFKHRNDAFAECMQRLDLDRRARLRDGPTYRAGLGTVVIVE